MPLSVTVDNRGEGELTVNTKARALTVYTHVILSNEKWFPITQENYKKRLLDCVIEIQELCWEANNIKVGKSMSRYEMRMNMQDMAASRCNRMMMLIETAKPLFHLTSKRVRFWLGMTKNLRDLIRGWHERDAERLRPTEPEA